MRILITGAGGAAAVSVWKSLATEHELYMADMDPLAAGLYLAPEKQRILIPRGDSPQFTQNVLEIAQKLRIDVLIPTVDVELAPLAAVASLFEQKGIKVPICSEAALKRCYDKYDLLNCCKDSGLVPYYDLLNKENIRIFKHFPYFAKPRIGAGSRGIAVIENQKDLEKLPLDNSYLIQELLPGEEYSVDVYIHSSNLPIAAVPRLRMKVDSGVAVAAQTKHLPELSQAAIQIAQLVGIRYVANIQFKRAVNGQFKLLEINPRFPGTLPLTAAAGIDIPRLLIDDINGKSVPSGLMPFKELMAVRYWTEKFITIKEWENVCRF